MSENLPVARAKNEKGRFGPASLKLIQLDELPTGVLSIGSLSLDYSPRQGGEDEEHVRVLAELKERLPPIVVHGQSMRVVDGIHRVRAAIMRGEEKIKAKIYYGTEDDAFVLAVRMNIAHGLPLTRADRTAAAVRIIGSHSHWSNRMIATYTGLSAGTVGKLRRSTVQNAQSITRVGKDGRVRPIDSAAGRLKVGELLAEKPTASIRAIAKEAGVSPSTVHHVRQRIRAGQNPALEPQRVEKSPAMPRSPDVCPPSRAPGKPGSAASVEMGTILANLKGDPSLRFSDVGRSLLQLLDKNRMAIRGSNKISEMVPDHCAGSVAKLARVYARVWTEVAAQLEKRWAQRSS